jgi:hypothetical protein
MRAAVGNFSLADIKDRGQRRNASDVVHNNAAREIENAPSRQDAAAPNHVGKGEVDKDEPCCWPMNPARRVRVLRPLG